MVISPTGSGKSLLMFLTHFLSKKSIMILCPLISLKNDLMKRARNLHLNCSNLSLEIDLSVPQIILVSPEQINSSLYNKTVNSLYFEGNLARVFVDECHLIITETYRECLKDFLTSRKVPIPVGFFSATMPPKLIEELKMEMMIDPLILRDTSRRKNIKYKIKRNENLQRCYEDVINSIEEKRADLKEGEKILVYCLFTNDCDELNRMIPKSVTYHSKLDSTEREANHAKWSSGLFPIMIATKAFGVGIDEPKIILIIHFGGSSSKLNFVQETGRVGRDGRISESLIITSPSFRHRLPPESENDFWDLLNSSNCIVQELHFATTGSYGAICIQKPFCWNCDTVETKGKGKEKEIAFDDESNGNGHPL